MAKFKDLTNEKFYKLTVLKRGENSKNNKTRWLCKCDCGKEVEILSACLINGYTKSCGCFYKEKYPDSLNNNKKKKSYFMFM